MRIPFTKAHGARNDFLLTWTNEAPMDRLAETARAICDRHTGIGADGWLLVTPGRKGAGVHGEIRLFNSDGSESEISGNGTRCAAAFLIDAGLTEDAIVIQTGAGPKHLTLIQRRGLHFQFEMNMGRPQYSESDLHFPLALSSGLREVSILNVGNPQCAVPVEDFAFDWQRLGAEIERHPHFPKRTNVSFYRPHGDHGLEVRFYERGAGVTMSSGTGSTGAVAAAILRGVVKSPVDVDTPAGTLRLRWEGEIFLTGPAEITAGGEFYDSLA